jgi:hypothetical protein
MTPQIFDINGELVSIGDTVVFPLCNDLCQGTVTALFGNALPCASLEFIDQGETLTVKRFKLGIQADNRRVLTLADGTKGYETQRFYKVTT